MGKPKKKCSAHIPIGNIAEGNTSVINYNCMHCKTPLEVCECNDTERQRFCWRCKGTGWKQKTVKTPA